MQIVAYAKAVVLNQHDQVLLLRRSATDKQRPGGQDYPGGGMEPGEDFTAGISREILEETGINVDTSDLKLFYAATECYKERSVTRLVFWTRVTDPEVTLSFEHDDYRWVSAEKVSHEFPHPVYGVAIDYGLRHRLFNPVINA